MRAAKTTASLLGGSNSGGHDVPLFASQPAAGFPSPGDDHIEHTLNINDLLVEHPESTFFVRVSGDSMEGAGIFSSDVLVVDRSITPKNGHIVVAAVFGELVVKRLAVQRGEHVLASEKEGYQPIHIAGSDDCFIWGVVVGSIRQFVP